MPRLFSVLPHTFILYTNVVYIPDNCAVKNNEWIFYNSSWVSIKRPTSCSCYSQPSLQVGVGGGRKMSSVWSVCKASTIYERQQIGRTRDSAINLLKWDQYIQNAKFERRIKMIRESRTLTYVRWRAFDSSWERTRPDWDCKRRGRGWPFFWSLNKMWQFVQRIITATTKGRQHFHFLRCCPFPSRRAVPLLLLLPLVLLWHPQSWISSASGFLSSLLLSHRCAYQGFYSWHVGSSS